MSQVYDKLIQDHPEYFWLNGGASGTTRRQGASTTLFFRPSFKGSDSDSRINAMRRQLDDRVKALITSAKRASGKQYEQILFLHDALVTQTDYVHTPHCHDAYGCLIDRRAVCDGYTAAFQLLMQRLGVECGSVHGTSVVGGSAGGSHAWNYIRLDDGYYYVDVTWDDPFITGASSKDNLVHDYFCVDLQQIQITHRFDPNQFIPSACGTKYDYYRMYGRYVEQYTFSAVRDIARRQVQSGKFSVKFSSRAQLDIAKRDLIENRRIYEIPDVPSHILYRASASGRILRVDFR